MNGQKRTVKLVYETRADSSCLYFSFLNALIRLADQCGDVGRLSAFKWVKIQVDFSRLWFISKGGHVHDDHAHGVLTQQKAISLTLQYIHHLLLSLAQ